MGPILFRVGISALAVVGTALGAGLIALGRYGDKVGAGEARLSDQFVVKYRMSDDQDFATHGERPGNPESALKSVTEAISVARTLMAAPPCQAKVFNIRTGVEVSF